MPAPPIKRTRSAPTLTPAQEILQAIAEALQQNAPGPRGVALNNVIHLALEKGLSGVTDVRVRGLREYCVAMLEVPLEHVDGTTRDPRIMTSEELVTVLLCGALFVQADRVCGRGVEV